MNDYRSMERQLSENLQLDRRPVAIAFLDTAPMGVSKFMGTEPSGCSFWRLDGGGGQYGSAEEATAFVNLLLEAPRHPPVRIYVVLTMRSDFLGDCSLFHDLPEAINEGQYLLPRLTREDRRAVIAGPVTVAEGSIDSALLTRLVNDVGDNPDHLSILQHALNRTWAQWRFHGNTEESISLNDYERTGTMASALDGHAEEAFAELKTQRQVRICEKLFKALTAEACRDPELQLALDWRMKQEPTAPWAALYQQGTFNAVEAFLDKSKQRRDGDSAETEVERRWRNSWGILIGILNLVLFLWVFDLYRDFTGAGQANRAIGIWDYAKLGFRAVLAVTVLGTPFLISFVAMAHYGKQAHRRFVFPKILAEISTGSAEVERPKKVSVEAAVALNTSYAAWWRRVVASVVDGTMFLVFFIVSFFIVGFVEAISGRLLEGDVLSQTSTWIAIALWWAMGWFNQVKTITSNRQATWGMRLARVFVTDRSGHRMSFARATLRHISKPVSYFAAIGLLIQPFTPRKQALHDLISNSVVLNRQAAPGL